MYNVVFMGSPDFAVKSLEALLQASEYDVKLVVTQTDKPQGRKQIMTPPPVKQVALQYGVEVYQPKTLRSDEAFEKLLALQPDFIVVAAYGKILPQNILDIPKYGCVNLHGSLLPKYRGAAPIQWSVINGDKETGVTTMLMNAGLDTGDILLTSKTQIGENETAGELFDRLADLCPALLLKTLRGLLTGEIVPMPQNDAEATYVSVLNKEMAAINWNDSAFVIHNKVRGMNPWPVAKTTFEGKLFKLFSGEALQHRSAYDPGVLYADGGSLWVSCGGNTVYRIYELQLEGSRKMTSAEFLRGHPLDRPVLLV